MLVASTPETTNPVATSARSTRCPASPPWRRGSPGSSPAAATRPWEPSTSPTTSSGGSRTSSPSSPTCGASSRPTSRSAASSPTTATATPGATPIVGFPPVLAKKGYTLVDPGRYQNLTDDFTAQINAFKEASAEIVTGVVIPPDFTTFWTQASQQGFRPKAATVGKAILFPVAVEALGDRGPQSLVRGLVDPEPPVQLVAHRPDAEQLADAYTAATGRHWTQPIGFIHALFEVAVDVLKRSADPTDREAVVEAIVATGSTPWRARSPGSAGQRVRATNVAKTPLVGGQWRRKDGGPHRPRHHRQRRRSRRSRPRSRWSRSPLSRAPARTRPAARRQPPTFLDRSMAMPILELGRRVQVLGALKVTDASRWRWRGRGARGHRPERGRQDHDVQPDRRGCGRMPGDPLRRTRHHPAPPQPAPAGIGRSYQIPHPFAKLTVFENLAGRRHLRRRQRERERRRPLRRHPRADRPARQANALGRAR